MPRRMAGFMLVCLYAWLPASAHMKLRRDDGASAPVRYIANARLKILALAGETKKPDRTPLVRVEPEYPETLRKLQIGGVIRLRVIISPKGSVEDVTLLGGNPILGDAAIAAVRKWVYAPTALQTTIEITIRFDPRIR